MPLDPAALDDLAAETSFSGAVRLDREGERILERAYGLAHRGYAVPNDVDTRFAIASGVKGLTALVIVSLVEDGVLELSTAARELLGEDLPLVDDRVTVEQLLAHRSGIGDYVDEDTGRDIADYVLGAPVHRLATTEDYLAVLDGYPTEFEPGERFAYCNGGYVVLALLAERASGVAFDDLVAARVCKPAGMADTAFLRSDELPERTAVGYLAANGLRTNALHLPVRGSGDGGIYTTLSDVSAFWDAVFGGLVVSPEWVAEMTRPRSRAEDGRRYGMGFWLPPSGDTVFLEGYDAGVSFRSLHDPRTDTTCTVVSNWTDGTWPLARYLADSLGL